MRRGNWVQVAPVDERGALQPPIQSDNLANAKSNGVDAQAGLIRSPAKIDQKATNRIEDRFTAARRMCRYLTPVQ